MTIKRRLPLILGAALPGVVMLSLSGEAVAQQSASAAAMLEEVIVTARRREENLQDLPLSIQAITADAMQAQGIYNIQQVTDFAPNVVLTEDQRKNDTRFYVRGIGGGFSNPAQVFGVGMYIDGHYISGSLGAFMSTVDLERVEVLRGPQGTLFGKNTTGGALSLVSAKPGPDFDSYITLRAADFGETGVRAMVNTAITDNVYLRANFASEQSDGYYYNRFFDADAGGTDQQSLGIAIRWQVGDNWTIDARAASSRDRDDNQGGQCVPRPNQDMYDKLTVNGAAGFAGPDLTSGTADDVFYNGPGPFNDGFGVPAWGGNNDNSSYRVANFVDAGTGLPGPGGSNLRIDALYPGANAAYLNSCLEDYQSGNIYQTYQDANTYSNVDNDMFTLDAQWDSDGAVGPFDSASVQIKGGWRYNSYNYYQDRDFGPGIIDHIGNNPKGSRGIARYTDEVELIFNGQVGDRFDLTAGVYWLDDIARAGNGTCLGQWIAAYDPNGVNYGPDNIPNTGDEDPNALGTVNGMYDDNVYCTPEGGTFFHRLPDSAGDRRSSTNAGQTTGTSKAVYGHMVYSLTDQWDLTFGARYMQDERGQAHIEYGTVPGTCSNIANPLTFCPDVVYLMNRSTLLDNGVHAQLSDSFSETTPTFSLTRHLTPGDTIDSGIVYGTISQGYLTGAFNDEVNPNAPGFSPDVRDNIIALLAYGPEHVTNYEVGYKATMFDGRLRLSADIFYMDYTDKQEAINVDNSDGRFGPDPAFEFTQNAADVDITGLELELRASPWDGGFVSLDLGTLDSKYSSFKTVNVDDPTGPLTDVSESSIANRTPDWSITATVEHAFQLANGSTLTPQLGVYMQDEMEWWSGLNRGEESPMCHQDSYAKWRARLTYEPSDANWQASLYGYNITDEAILYRCASARSGAYARFYEAPAQWGAEFQMRFGGQ